MTVGNNFNMRTDGGRKCQTQELRQLHQIAQFTKHAHFLINSCVNSGNLSTFLYYRLKEYQLDHEGFSIENYCPSSTPPAKWWGEFFEQMIDVHKRMYIRGQGPY